MGKFSKICPVNHLKAILYRRYITFKRSWKAIIISMVGTLILSALGIAVYWMMVGMNSIKDEPISFNSYAQDRKDFVIIGDKENQLASEIVQKLKENYLSETGKEPEILNYNSVDEMQKSFYDLQKKKKMKYLIPFGLDFTKNPPEIIVFFNSTTNNEIENPDQLEIFAFVLVGQALWQLQYNSNSTNANKYLSMNTYSNNHLNTNENNHLNTNENNHLNTNSNNYLNTNENNHLNTNENNHLNTNENNHLNTNENNHLNTNSNNYLSTNEKNYLNASSYFNRRIIQLESKKQKGIKFNFIRMNKNGIGTFFQALCPMFLVFGLLTIVMLIITTPIADIRGEIRSYMIQCTLKIFPYWFGAFVVDLAIWVIITTIVWGLFNLGWVKPFHDNLFTIWWILVFDGPSFLLFLYSFSFCFKNPESGPRQIFIILLVVNFVVIIITLILSTHPIWLNWIWSLFPTISIQQDIYLTMKNTGLSKKSFGYYWKDKETQPFFIMQWVDIVLYSLILTIIEVSRKSLARAAAKHSFSGYSDYFDKLKNKDKDSPETKKMEDEVHNSHEWAVRIENVSRLFINTAGKPIPAVNSVCLGIKEGMCFGFLGANGAGKTTLMRMITGTLPPSSGSIEIFKTPIEDIKDTTILSICPQFNTHLFFELTPKEHFKIYSWLFQKDPQEAKTLTNSLISELELMDFKNIPLRELSTGDVRKLAIAISFFGPSKLLLLDEPTAFLDPVACHCVQEMILEHKRKKTFMLCTHILNEAELLCDIISIMVRGNVYTVGTPQYLTQKFGTEYKIDLMLEDASEKSATKVDEFFSLKLPFAQLTITRPASRIYSVPASEIKLAELFLIMEKGQIDKNGYKYFTCSTSSLERVFMEIVRISEQEDSQQKDGASKDNEQQKDKDMDDIHIDMNHIKNNDTDSDNSVENIP